MRILIERRWQGQKSTLSTVAVDGIFFGYCLEDRDRGLTSDMALEEISTIKVKTETAIPTGVFSVSVTYSNRFKRRMPILLNVPGFAGVRIHSGNRHGDTEGCPLFGRRWQATGKDYIVLDSRDLCKELYQKIDAALKAGEKVTCEIVSAYENYQPVGEGL